jgi:hypothetical protein
MSLIADKNGDDEIEVDILSTYSTEEKIMLVIKAKPEEEGTKPTHVETGDFIFWLLPPLAFNNMLYFQAIEKALKMFSKRTEVQGLENILALDLKSLCHEDYLKHYYFDFNFMKFHFVKYPFEDIKFEDFRKFINPEGNPLNQQLSEMISHEELDYLKEDNFNKISQQAATLVFEDLYFMRKKVSEFCDKYMVELGTP